MRRIQHRKKQYPCLNCTSFCHLDFRPTTLVSFLLLLFIVGFVAMQMHLPVASTTSTLPHILVQLPTSPSTSTTIVIRTVADDTSSQHSPPRPTSLGVREIAVRNSTSSVRPLGITCVSPNISSVPAFRRMAGLLKRLTHDLPLDLAAYGPSTCSSCFLPPTNHSVVWNAITHHMWSQTIPPADLKIIKDAHRSLRRLVWQDQCAATPSAQDSVTIVVRSEGTHLRHWIDICWTHLRLNLCPVVKEVIFYRFNTSLPLPLDLPKQIRVIDVSRAGKYKGIGFSLNLAKDVIQSPYVLRIDEDRCVERCSQIEYVVDNLMNYRPESVVGSREVLRGFDPAEDDNNNYSCYSTRYERRGHSKKVPSYFLATNAIYSRIWPQLYKDVMPQAIMEFVSNVMNGEDITFAWFQALFSPLQSQFNGEVCSEERMRPYSGLACGGCYKNELKRRGLAPPRQIQEDAYETTPQYSHNEKRTRILRMLFRFFSPIHFFPRRCGPNF